MLHILAVLPQTLSDGTKAQSFRPTFGPCPW